MPLIVLKFDSPKLMLHNLRADEENTLKAQYWLKNDKDEIILEVILLFISKETVPFGLALYTTSIR